MNPIAALDVFLRARQLDTPHITGLVVALSGGPDSMALLAAVALRAVELNYSLRAVHIHHGLQVEADAWAAQAVRQAQALAVPAAVLRVAVSQSQASLEGAAREARYSALMGDCGVHEALLLGHHRDDQAETLLLRLMRGAGLQGLAAMRGQSSWRMASGEIRERWRPWLGVSREQLMRWLDEHLSLRRLQLGLASGFAEAAALKPVQDPANADPRFARTTLRHDILPRLERFWPDASVQIAQSAVHLAQQAQALDSLADIVLTPWLAENANCIEISGLLALPAAVYQTLIARWLQRSGAPALPRRYWPRVSAELLQTRSDAQPQLAWAGWSLRRYRERIYIVRDEDVQALPAGVAWPDPRQPIEWAEQLWSVEQLCPELAANSPALSKPWRLAARQGGERYRPLPELPSKRVKHWCQETHIPPWQRDRVACVWAGDEVVALKLVPSQAPVQL